jgi:predicted dehydrogenase
MISYVLIGAGGISRAHLSALEAMKSTARLTAVVEPNVASRDAVVERTGATGFADLSSFVAAGGSKLAQAALVCTPPNVRTDIVRSLATAGLSVFVEKPIAHQLAAAKTLLDVARSNAAGHFAVGYCHRFTPAMIEMKRRADAGELGQVLRFENTFACWFPSMQQHWMSEPTVSGGGSFLDTGCHSLDLFRFLIGDATAVSAVFGSLWKGRGESHATVVVRSVSTARHTQCVGVIQSGWAEAARFTVGLVGTKSSIFYDYEKPTELLVVPSEGQRRTESVETHEVRFQRQLESFTSLMSGTRAGSGPANFDDGVAVAKLVDETARIRQII